MHVCIVCTYVCKYVHVYVCTCVYMYVCICFCHILPPLKSDILITNRKSALKVHKVFTYSLPVPRPVSHSHTEAHTHTNKCIAKRCAVSCTVEPSLRSSFRCYVSLFAVHRSRSSRFIVVVVVVNRRRLHRFSYAAQ